MCPTASKIPTHPPPIPPTAPASCIQIFDSMLRVANSTKPVVLSDPRPAFRGVRIQPNSSRNFRHQATASGAQGDLKTAFSRLQNGSDIRGIALDLVEEEPVRKERTDRRPLSLSRTGLSVPAAGHPHACSRVLYRRRVRPLVEVKAGRCVFGAQGFHRERPAAVQ